MYIYVDLYSEFFYNTGETLTGFGCLCDVRQSRV